MESARTLLAELLALPVGLDAEGGAAGMELMPVRRCALLELLQLLSGLQLQVRVRVRVCVCVCVWCGVCVYRWRLWLAPGVCLSYLCYHVQAYCRLEALHCSVGCY